MASDQRHVVILSVLSLPKDKDPKDPMAAGDDNDPSISPPTEAEAEFVGGLEEAVLNAACSSTLCSLLAARTDSTSLADSASTSTATGTTGTSEEGHGASDHGKVAESKTPLITSYSYQQQHSTATERVTTRRRDSADTATLPPTISTDTGTTVINVLNPHAEYSLNDFTLRPLLSIADTAVVAVDLPDLMAEAKSVFGSSPFDGELNAPTGFYLLRLYKTALLLEQKGVRPLVLLNGLSAIASCSPAGSGSTTTAVQQLEEELASAIRALHRIFVGKSPVHIFFCGIDMIFDGLPEVEKEEERVDASIINSDGKELPTGRNSSSYSWLLPVPLFVDHHNCGEIADGVALVLHSMAVLFVRMMAQHQQEKEVGEEEGVPYGAAIADIIEDLLRVVGESKPLCQPAAAKPGPSACSGVAATTLAPHCRLAELFPLGRMLSSVLVEVGPAPLVAQGQRVEKLLLSRAAGSSAGTGTQSSRLLMSLPETLKMEDREKLLQVPAVFYAARRLDGVVHPEWLEPHPEEPRLEGWTTKTVSPLFGRMFAGTVRVGDILLLHSGRRHSPAKAKYLDGAPGKDTSSCEAYVPVRVTGLGSLLPRQNVPHHHLPPSKSTFEQTPFLSAGDIGVVLLAVNQEPLPPLSCVLTGTNPEFHDTPVSDETPTGTCILNCLAYNGESAFRDAASMWITNSPLFSIDVVATPTKQPDLVRTVALMVSREPALTSVWRGFSGGYTLLGVNLAAMLRTATLYFATGKINLEVDPPVCQLFETVLAPTVKAHHQMLGIDRPSSFTKSLNKHNRLWIRSEALPMSMREALVDGCPSSLSTLNQLRRLPPDATSDWRDHLPDRKEVFASALANGGANLFIDDTGGVRDLDEVKDALSMGFQLSCREGPLFEAPLQGVACSLVMLHVSANPFHKGGGQIVPAVRKACLGAALSAQPRILVPVVELTLCTLMDLMEGRERGALPTRRKAEVEALVAKYDGVILPVPEGDTLQMCESSSADKEEEEEGCEGQQGFGVVMTHGVLVPTDVFLGECTFVEELSQKRTVIVSTDFYGHHIYGSSLPGDTPAGRAVKEGEIDESDPLVFGSKAHVKMVEYRMRKELPPLPFPASTYTSSEW